MANRRGKLETLTDFIFLGSKITADSDYSHEIKTHLLIGRKVMTNLACILKKQRYYFASKCLYSQSYSFARSCDGWENWTIRKAKYQGIVAFKLWCWKRLLRVLWTEKRSNQSMLNEISP